ncbi:MAG: hypothetical protein KC731_10370 [Myxococcales bacterium]|nr:hypothetical protein [Myxococcales bacterium]
MAMTRLDEDTRLKLIALVHREGVDAFAASIGMSVGALTRALVPLDVRVGTILQLQLALANYTDSEAA